MTSIQFCNLIKRYGTGEKANQVLHGVNAEIRDGEFVVIVGPSGCGKSTLLRMVAGLEDVSDGEIRIGGEVVNQLEPAQRDIAMVFQNYALYPHMTVQENMAYGLKIRKTSKEEIQGRVEKAAKILGLSHLLQRKPRELSGGQRQRVAMGRAIVREPKVFLFDEPLSNLDAQLRVQTRLEIEKLHRELGITSLFVTHDQVEAMTLAQRMIVMNAGRMEQFGTPEEVYSRPASTFVASFIGAPAMNLLKQVQGCPQPRARRVLPRAMNLLKQVQGCPEGKILGIRPEHLTISPTQESDCWSMRIESNEMLGAERLLHGKVGEEDITLRLDATLPTAQVGETIYVRPQKQLLHFFDLETGKRIDGAH